MKTKTGHITSTALLLLSISLSTTAAGSAAPATQSVAQPVKTSSEVVIVVTQNGTVEISMGGKIILIAVSHTIDTREMNGRGKGQIIFGNIKYVRDAIH